MSDVADRATVVWRRLDVPGYEAAAVERTSDGWRLSGVAVLTNAGRPCRLDYDIACDSRWVTRHAVVTGSVGDSDVALEVARDSAGNWILNGAPVAGLQMCEDVDLAFSPVTNLLPIRRLALDIGMTAQLEAAWIRFPELTIAVLPQSYTRVDATHYKYESAGGAFQRTLTVDPSGFVLDYPGLWIAEARSGQIG